MENITIRNTKTGAVRHNMNAYAWSLNTNKGDWHEVAANTTAVKSAVKTGFIPDEIKALKEQAKPNVDPEPSGDGKAIVNTNVADDVTTQKTTPAKVVQANIASKPIEKKNYPTATKK